MRRGYRRPPFCRLEFIAADCIKKMIILIKHVQTDFYNKHVIFEGFSQNGLQIRIQSEKLRISALDEFLRFV